LPDRRVEVPGVTVEQRGNVVSVTVSKTADAELRRAFGTQDAVFLEGLVRQVAILATDGSKVEESVLNWHLAAAGGLSPKDHAEAMLSVQMVAVHRLVVESARRLANAEHLLEVESTERTLNRLCRTFAKQVEALKKYRSAGAQTITVQHVSVADGAQAAVIGTLSREGG
jgi:hypothetical protein